MQRYIFLAYPQDVFQYFSTLKDKKQKFKLIKLIAAEIVIDFNMLTNRQKPIKYLKTRL